MSEQKVYEVPREVADLMVERASHEKLRDTFAKLPFGYKKAVKHSRLAEKCRTEYWEKVSEIYPELRGRKVITGGNFTGIWEQPPGPVDSSIK